VGAILTAVDTYCTGSLGSGVREVEFYQRGVGAVFGLGLDDGSSVVVKVHRPEIAGGRLDAISLVQRHLADRGLPAPRPLAPPAPLAHGIATAEELLRAGTVGNAHHPSVRTGLAEGLFGFVEAATPLLETVPVEETWPVSLPEGRLWPVPHDLRFDFTLPGAGWIDDLGAAALRRLRPPHGRTVIGHRDWRVENPPH